MKNKKGITLIKLIIIAVVIIGVIIFIVGSQNGGAVKLSGVICLLLNIMS